MFRLLFRVLPEKSLFPMQVTEGVERVAGIEPAWPAWKAGTLPLSYTRDGSGSISTEAPAVNGNLSDIWQEIRTDYAVDREMPAAEKQ